MPAKSLGWHPEKVCTKCKVLKLIDLFPSAPKRSDGHGSWCRQCCLAYEKEKRGSGRGCDRGRRYRAKNRELLNEKSRARSKLNRARVSANHANWVVANPERAREIDQRSREKNRDKCRQRNRIWTKQNREKKNAYEATRAASKLRATPVWANPFFMEEAYELALRRALLLGFPWQVDHIVPLVSRFVCGLHVEHNLRVVPAIVNASKGNRHWPDMPGVG